MTNMVFQLNQLRECKGKEDAREQRLIVTLGFGFALLFRDSAQSLVLARLKASGTEVFSPFRMWVSWYK